MTERPGVRQLGPVELPPSSNTDAEVRRALSRILSSTLFARTPALKNFLDYIVVRTLAGRMNELKEHTIGTEVFQRGPNFDPRIDPIVRVQASKLRVRLDRYYHHEGSAEQIRIMLRPGSYVPAFESLTANRTCNVSVFPDGSRTELETPSLAVLPFLNLTGDPEFEYFTDGLGEEIIGVVGRIPELRVIARTSSYAFKGTNTGLAEIGRKLSANLVLEGSVRRSGDTIRVTALLNDVPTGHQIWARQYDARLEEVFAVQDEIAGRIAETIRGTPLLDSSHGLGNIDSHLFLMRGWYCWNRCDPEFIPKALEYFEQAVAHDTTNARAHAAVALALALESVYGLLAPQEAIPKADRAVQLAIRYGAEIADSWGAKGGVESTLKWNWNESIEAYERALRINPNNVLNRHAYAVGCLMPLGRFDQLIDELQAVLRLDPLSAMTNCDLATAYTYAGLYKEALTQYDSALELEPANLRTKLEKGWCMLHAGQISEGLEIIDGVVEIAPIPVFQGIRALGLALASRGGEALESLESLRGAYGDGRLHFNPPIFALDALGFRDEALTEFEHAYERRDTHLRLVNVDPRAHLLRHEPRFQVLIRKMGLMGPVGHRFAQNR